MLSKMTIVTLKEYKETGKVNLTDYNIEDVYNFAFECSAFVKTEIALNILLLIINQIEYLKPIEVQ